MTFTASKCFQYKEDHGVSNSKSIAELFRVTVGDCLNYCILNAARMGDGCSSVTYHKMHSTCQLYGHSGNFHEAEVVPAYGHDFYERTSWVGVCQDKAVPKRGYKQHPRQYAAQIEPVESPIELTKYENSLDSQMGSLDFTVMLSSENLYKSAIIFEEPTDGYRFLNPTHSNACQKEETVSYFVFFGYRLASTNVAARLKGIDQSSCVMYCTQNINSNGETIPCYAANYEPADEKCYLYGERSKSDRNIAHLGTDANFIFADKFCVQSKKQSFYTRFTCVFKC
ncbi:PAN domain protein [Cooperia oncophora]